MIRAISTSFLFILLMAAGWGSADFFLDIPHLILSVALLCAALFSHQEEERGIKPGEERGESRLEFVLIAFLSTIGIFLLFPFFSGHALFRIPLPEPFRYFGVMLCLVGYLIRLRAVRTLKQQFSYFVTVQRNHQLITTGIYSRIRHPVYLGILLLVVGMFFLFPTWYGFLFIIIYSMLLSHRMSREEKLLLKYFGTVYQEYSSKSYRLIPHIY